MLLRHFIAVCLVVVLALISVGCASVGGGSVSGINWALAKNGGHVSAFTEEPDFPASTLIDGVTVPEDWDKAGAGWKAQITMGGMTRSTRGQRDEQGRNWVLIELPQPVTVNRVKVYTVDSEKYPANKFGVSDLLIQYEMKTTISDLLWVNVKRPGKGINDQDDAIRNNTSGVIDARFEPVTTQKIKLLIYATNDTTKTGDGRSREGVIRISEIEVYGSGQMKPKNEIDNLFDTK